MYDGLKTPQQNGVADRLNRTLVESARSMLLNANLSKCYWAEAVSTTVYLKNRCPTKAVQGMTPFEIWHEKKPMVDHLRVFGCDAYSHILKDERGKFATKARKCILLGYGEETKGYRLYDVEKKKVLYSRDVKFNEGAKNCRDDSQTVSTDDYKLIVNFSSEGEHETVQDVEDEQPIHDILPRRSIRQRIQPNYYGREQSHLTETPTNFHDANASQDKVKWKVAMETEMKSLKENKVWDLVKLPPGRKTVGSKEENRNRWFSPKIQSKACCTRVYQEIWYRLR